MKQYNSLDCLDTFNSTCILSKGGAVFLLLFAGLNYAGTQRQYGESDLKLRQTKTKYNADKIM